MHVHDVCVGNIYRRTYPRAHVMATAASSARATARTLSWEVMQPHARPYPSLTPVHIYLRIYMYNGCVDAYLYIHINKYIYMHTCTPSLLDAAISKHVGNCACACPHVCAHTHARARAGGAAAHNGPRRIDDPPSASRLRWCAAGPKRRRIPLVTR